MNRDHGHESSDCYKSINKGVRRTISNCLLKDNQRFVQSQPRWIRILILSLIVFLLSTITNSTAQAQQELPPWRTNLDCDPDQQKFSGIEYCSGKSTYSNASVIVVDLQAPDIKFEYIIADGTDREGEYGECQDVNRASKKLGGPGCDAPENPFFYPVMDLASALKKFPDAAVVINSDYGATNGDEPGSREHGPEGFTVVQGTRIDGPLLGDGDNNAVRRPWLAVSESSPLKAGIFQLASDNGEVWEWIYTGVGGGPRLIQNGQILPGVSTDCIINYRTSCYDGATQTAVGLTNDGRWLFLVVMTGVSKDLHELVNFMSSSLNVEEAIKFDGGGSSQLWYAGLPPSQQDIVPSSRRLAQYLGIFAQTGNGINIATQVPDEISTPAISQPTIQESKNAPGEGSATKINIGIWWNKIKTSVTQFFNKKIDGFGLGSSAHLRLGSESVHSAYEQMKSMGIRWTREEIPWGEVEDTPNNFRWAYPFGNTPRDFPALFHFANENQIEIVALLDYGPIYLADPTPDELIERWEIYVQAVVSKFGDEIDYWEIGNEMNSRKFWGKVVYPGSDRKAEPDPALYAKLLSSAYEIIKSDDPGDVVILGGLIVITEGDCPTDPYAYLGKLYEAGVWDKFDIIGFHPYWGPPPQSNKLFPPEQAVLRGKQHDPRTGACVDENRTSNLIGDIRDLSDLTDQFGSKPIWITEIGWNQSWLEVLAGYRGTTADNVEADYVVRTYVPLLSEPGVEKVFWYTQVRDIQAENFELGKSGQLALSNLAHLLTDSKPLGQVQGQDYLLGTSKDDVQEYRFKKDDKIIIVTWKAAGGDVPRQVIIQDLPNGEALGYSADAKDLLPESGISIPIENHSLVLQLTEKPVILIIKKSNSVDQWLGDIQLDLKSWVNQTLKSISDQIKGWIDTQIEKLSEQLLHQLENFQLECCGSIFLPLASVFILIVKGKRRTVPPKKQ